MDVSGDVMDVNENTDLGSSEYATASKAKKDAAVPVVNATTPASASGIHKVVIISKLTKYDKLRKAMNDLGVTGMTVTQVMGCGIQKGAGEKYRGAELDATLLPKVKVEVIVGKIPVERLLRLLRRLSTPDISEMARSLFTTWHRLSRFVQARKELRHYRM